VKFVRQINKEKMQVIMRNMQVQLKSAGEGIIVAGRGI
jgi:hypothetical protein